MKKSQVIAVFGAVALAGTHAKAQPDANFSGAPALEPTNTVDQKMPARLPWPVITPTGVMSILGRTQVIFNVADSDKSKLENSYVLSEGESRAGVKVLKISQGPSTNTVTFDNHGVIQAIPILAAKITSPPPTVTAQEDYDESDSVFRPVVPRNFAGGVQVADFGRNQNNADNNADDASIFFQPPVYLPPTTPPLVNAANAPSWIGTPPPLVSTPVLPSTPTAILPPPPIQIPGASIIVIPSGQ